MQELLPVDEDLESDVSDDDNSEEDIETKDLDENMLIKETTRGQGFTVMNIDEYKYC